MEFTLEPWQEKFIPDVARLADNPKIAGNLRNVFPSPYTYEDAEWYVRDCIQKGEERQCTRAIVVDGHAAGSIGLFLQGDVYEKNAELGYWLGEEYWQKGIMSRAVEEICAYAFEHYDIVRIYAEPFTDNLGSRGVLEKAGFFLEGILKGNVYKNGVFHDSCVYGLYKDREKLREKNQMNPLTLAFLGDAVYEQMVRERLVSEAERPVNQLHRMAVERVCAGFQAKAVESLLPVLTEEEEGIFRRGRNSSNHAVPKSSNPADYRKATGFESLFGYLYLSGKTERLKELFERIWSDPEIK